MDVVYKKVTDLIEYQNNPRKNDAAVDACARSIKSFGFRVPVVIDKVDGNNVIISGHTRRLAAMHLGLEQVPVYVAEDMSPEQAQAYRIVDNRIAELASWDSAKLKEEVAQIIGIDLSAFGFSEKMLQDAFDGEAEVRQHVCPRCGCEFVI